MLILLLKVNVEDNFIFSDKINAGVCVCSTKYHGGHSRLDVRPISTECSLQTHRLQCKTLHDFMNCLFHKTNCVLLVVSVHFVTIIVLRIEAHCFTCNFKFSVMQFGQYNANAK